MVRIACYSKTNKNIEVTDMSEIKESALELIGGTPLLKLNRYSENAGVKDAAIIAKGTAERN